MDAARSLRSPVLSLGWLSALALVVRLWGISFGLPYIYSFDESTSVGEALGLIRGTTEALSFANPPLYKYLLVGLFSAIVGPQRLAEVDLSLLYLIARAASAVLGALTIVFVYAIARQLRGHWTGVTAAGLAAVTYLLVRESHFGVNDALATLCTTAAMAACIRVACRGTRGDYVVAGAGVGLAFAAKYQAAVVLVPLTLAHLLHGRRRQDGDWLLGLGVAALTAVVAFPPLLTEGRRVVADVYVFLMLPSRLGFDGLDPAGAYVYYVKTFGWGIGWPLLAVACFGIGRAVVQREWPLLVVASLPVGLYLVMGSSHMYVARFMLPGLPALIVVAAVVLNDLGRHAWPVAAIVGCLVVAGTLPTTVRFDALMGRVDTRTQARTWIQANVPAGARVAAEGPAIGPPLDNLSLDLVSPPGHAVYDVTLDEYRAQGVEYVVTSSYSAEAPNLDPARDAQRRDFYASLQRTAERIADFQPYRGTEPDFVYDRVYAPFDSLDHFEQPGPTISVYRLTAAASP